MEFWIKAAQLLFSLSILVVLHELGHFIPAKLFKTRVEKFYLFFNPWFSLFKFKRGDTEYGIGWIPLGGYVKISGMIDESMDKEQMKKEPEPHEFRSKPAWQRLIIMVGGVTVNLLLGFFLYMVVLFSFGEDRLHVEDVKYGISCDSLLYHYGFEEGDKILSLDGNTPEDFMDVNTSLLLDDVRKVTIERGGSHIDLELPEDFGQMMVDSGVKMAVYPRLPSYIGTIDDDSQAGKSDLKVGDLITAIDGSEIEYFNQVSVALRGKVNQTVVVSYTRDGIAATTEVTTNEKGQLGIRADGNLERFFEIEHVEYSFGEAIPAGFTLANKKLRQYVVSMKFLFSSAGVKQIGGFGTIGSLYPSEWNWEAIWITTAFLSLILAFMNILPIPALDGGHVMFLLWEMVSGKPPGDKFLERAQIVGMIILLGLLLFANGNDIWRWMSGS